MRTDKPYRIATAAKGVFLRYGYRRVTMSDIAIAAGISRAALYLVYSNKEDVFRGVFDIWVDETLADIAQALPALGSPREQVSAIFEIWAVRSFEAVLDSPEAKELLECGFDFARPSLDAAYARLEATMVPIVDGLLTRRSRDAGITGPEAAHVLTSAVRGFKQVATSADALRALIANLLVLWLD